MQVFVYNILSCCSHGCLRHWQVLNTRVSRPVPMQGSELVTGGCLGGRFSCLPIHSVCPAGNSPDGTLITSSVLHRSFVCGERSVPLISRPREMCFLQFTMRVWRSCSSSPHPQSSLAAREDVLLGYVSTGSKRSPLVIALPS